MAVLISDIFAINFVKVLVYIMRTCFGLCGVELKYLNITYTNFRLSILDT